MKTLSCLALLVTAMAAPAADWSRFRGPNGTGIGDAPHFPVNWNLTDNLLWKVELPGVGNGSPIIVAGKAYLQCASPNGSKRQLVCIDVKKGTTDWTTTLDAQTAHVHAKNTLASSTPACDGERIYAIFWNGSVIILYAFDLKGKELWNKTLGGFESQHGAGASPVVHMGKVFVNYDQDKKAEVIAYDSKTGDIAWRAKRKAFRACYSTPIVRDLPGGKSELVISSTEGVSGYDPATGKVNWNWEWTFHGMPLRTVASPMVAGDYVLAISGDGGGDRSAAVVKPGEKDAVWMLKKQKTPYVPCPIIKGDYIYWVTDQGMAACIEVVTGKEVWSERLPKVKSVSASLFMVNDHITAIAEDGIVVTFKANPKEYEQLASTKLNDAIFASPAVADGRVFLRGSNSLYCIGEKGSRISPVEVITLCTWMMGLT